MLETNPIAGEMLIIPFEEYDHDPGIRFNNNVTKRYIKHIVKNELILFVHTKYAKEALKIANKIKHYRIKGSLSRVCIWCTGESKKQFRQRIKDALNNP